MHKKKSSLSILHALVCMLFFLNLSALADIAPDTISDAIDISRSLGVNIITKPGFYFISRTFPSALRIRSSDVVLELAGNTVLGGIDIGTNLQNVTVQNGIIDGNNTLTNGVSASAGCKQIVLKDLQIKNGTRGIMFSNVSNGLVANCELTLNTTGVDLIDSHNIIVENTIASRNRATGFGMLRSTTCCFTECKALGTGQGNTNVTNNTVIGFSTINGSGNIFERCIADGTQALLTTDYNSIIAGFALRGTENSSKIIACEAANATTSASGFTVPYGILLEGTLPTLLDIFALPDPTPGDKVQFLDWSPNGKYLAVGIESGSNMLRVYQFNPNVGTLVQVAVPPVDEVDTDIRAVAWHPSGEFLVASSQGSSLMRMYRFDQDNYTLLQVGDTVDLIDYSHEYSWMPDGNYFAGAMRQTDPARVRVFAFDPISYTVSNFAVASPVPDDAAISIDVSSDGKYVAAGFRSGDSLLVRVYSFNPASSTPLTQVASPSPALPAGNATRSVRWSPDGQYLAIGRDVGVDGRVYVYRFNRTANTLIELATYSFTSGANDRVISVDWSPDGQYVATRGVSGASVLTGNAILRFDRSSNQLLLAATSFDQDFGYGFPGQIRWNPDGRSIAVVGATGTPPYLYVMYGLTFPSHNVIKNNTVYCNSGAQFPSGVGISGSSIVNMIIQNVAYANPIAKTINQPIVESNYYFVTNVFNPFFQQAPTALQNIAVGDRQPISMQEDNALLLKQALFKATSASDELSLLINQISSAAACGATQLTQGTISASGYYCLGQNLTAGLVINASNVTLDLNGRRIAGGITFSNRDFIKIMNGIVEGTASTHGISATNSTNVTLDQVTVKNALIGVNFSNVYGSTISACTFVQNTTGAAFTLSENIVVNDSTALRNKNTGFELLQSTTCIFQDCKALSTGDSNTTLRNNCVLGFVASNGLGNIFERCIANSTQALSTTDFNSIVAGFMFTGTERCSKIIECESADATTSPNGVTVPYGILLQAQFSGLLTVTAINPGGGSTGDTASEVAWSPDGLYLAVGGTIAGGSDADVLIYRFDRLNRLLVLVASVNPGDGGASDIVSSLAWSPDGLYLAVGGTIGSFGSPDLYLYQFDRVSGSLTQILAFDPLGRTSGGYANDGVGALAWSPDGFYLAVGGDISGGSGNDLLIYSFDRSKQSLTQIADANPNGGAGDFISSIAWSPDGLYLAISGTLYGGSGADLFIYQFNSGAQSLTQITSLNPGGSSDLDDVPSSAWSPDGIYLAAGWYNLSDSLARVTIYQFNRVAGALQEIVSVNPAGGAAFEQVYSVAWSPDGVYLAVGGNINGGGNEDLLLYRFDRGDQSLTQIAAANPGGGGGDTVFSIAWSPDGMYLAVAGTISGGGNEDVIIYQVLNFPTQNIIQDNTVYCNSGARFPSGIGISGSSIANMIIQNTAYTNPVPQNITNAGPIVFSNYAFVTNVFNQQLQNEPSLLQNISLANKVPIVTPSNTALIIKQATAQMTSISNCAPYTITMKDNSFGSYIIGQGGNYCVGEDLPMQIYFNTNNISLDLNGKSVYNVRIFGNDAVVQNGIVAPPANSGLPAVDINSPYTRVILNGLRIITPNETVTTNNALNGIECYANNCQILNCTISTGNGGTGSATPGNGGTGILLASSSSNNVVRNCVIKTGDGGNSTGAAAGGAGGIGISVDGAQVEIVGCTIMQTGTGGNSVSGTTGAGGHAIAIASTAVNVAVHDCTMRNTGNSGTVGSPRGMPGKAVFDLVTTAANRSMIYKNFACYVSNVTKFDIQAPGVSGGPEDGIYSPNPPTATLLNPWANVFTIP